VTRVVPPLPLSRKNSPDSDKHRGSLSLTRCPSLEIPPREHQDAGLRAVARPRCPCGSQAAAEVSTGACGRGGAWKGRCVWDGGRAAAQCHISGETKTVCSAVAHLHNGGIQQGTLPLGIVRGAGEGEQPLCHSGRAAVVERACATGGIAAIATVPHSHELPRHLRRQGVGRGVCGRADACAPAVCWQRRVLHVAGR
jgi:hypothetical protein